MLLVRKCRNSSARAKTFSHYLAQGGSLTSDEKDVIEQSAIDLLTNVKPDTWTRAFRKRLFLGSPPQ